MGEKQLPFSRHAVCIPVIFFIIKATEVQQNEADQWNTAFVARLPAMQRTSSMGVLPDIPHPDGGDRAGGEGGEQRCGCARHEHPAGHRGGWTVPAGGGAEPGPSSGRSKPYTTAPSSPL